MRQKSIKQKTIELAESEIDEDYGVEEIKNEPMRKHN